MRKDALVRLAAIFCLALTPSHSAHADIEVYSLPTGETAAQDHWPAADSLIGTGDDTVNQTNSPMNNSSWNSPGSFSYNAFDFGSGLTETGLLPAGMNAATFLSGTVTVDTDVARNGGGALLTAWNVSGTEPFAGHGAYSAQITAVNSGTYDATSKAFTMNVDFVANLTGGTANAVNFDLSGRAWFVDLLVSPTTGNTYVDDVLVPMAQANAAKSLIFLLGSGTVPASSGGSGGSFPSMPVVAAIVATGNYSIPVESHSWGRVKAMYHGGR